MDNFIDVKACLKGAAEDIRILIIHSAEDLGRHVAETLRRMLEPGIQCVGCEEAPTYRALIDVIQSADAFHVLLLIMHGEDSMNSFLPSADPVGMFPVELAAALGCKAHDSLVLFGICHSGSNTLSESMIFGVGDSEAVANVFAYVAPAPSATISGRDIVCGYGNVINALQRTKDEVGLKELHRLIRSSVSPDLYSRLVVSGASQEGGNP